MALECEMDIDVLDEKGISALPNVHTPSLKTQ